jgi:hypothetical protein
MGAAQNASTAPSVPDFGTDVLVNDRSTDTWTHITQSETTVASGNSVILAAFNDSHELPANATGYARSTNAGASWTDMGRPTVPLGVVDAVFGDPTLASDRVRGQGTAPFYMSNLGTLANGTSIVSVHKTIDGGLTWVSAANATPGALAADFQDKSWMAVDTRASGTGAGNVYVCWTRFISTGGQQIRLSRSTDGGATFQIIQTDLSADADVSGCQVAVDPNNGNVYVTWLNQNSLVSPRTVKFRASTDQGTSFAAEQQIGTSVIWDAIINCGGGNRTVSLDTEASPNSRAIRSKPFPDIAVNPTNSEIYVVFHAGSLPSGNETDIAFVQSSDFGATWTPQVRINKGKVGQQFMPSIGVNKSGTARVMYYSTQNSQTDRLLDVYTVTSTDGGTTWGGSKRVTDVSFDRPTTNPNFDTFIASCYMGDYNQIEAAPKGLGPGQLNILWGDNRLDGNAGMGGVQPDPDIRFDK